MTDPYVVLHGGFHKTATSHVQSTLGRNARLLERHGIRYVHHRDTRKEITVPCQLNVYDKKGLDYRTKYSDAELATRTGAFFESLTAKPVARLIMSEENMAGHCGHCVKRGLLYRWRQELISTFAAQFPWPVREVHLGVRNYADFFASAYVEYLRSVTSGNFVDDRMMRKRVLEHMPNWHKVLRLVQECFPHASLHVWRYEDFRLIDHRILANLCGPGFDAALLKPPAENNKRPTASGRAVAELLQKIHMVGAEAALAQRVEIQQAYPKGDIYGAYDPWTPQERAHLTRMYERDVADMRCDPDIELIEPDPAGASSRATGDTTTSHAESGGPAAPSRRGQE